MTAPLDERAGAAGRALRLKMATGTAHDRLDKLIMRCDPFASRERYGRFLAMQYAFHCEIDALYDDPSLLALLPDLRQRRRLALIARDLADLGVAPPGALPPPAFAPATVPDLPAALGWLYVAEGSSLGAVLLLKAAEKLGLSESFGARHLAGAPEGRGLYWRTFTAALDGVPLSPAGEARVVAGATAAFSRVRELAIELLG